MTTLNVSVDSAENPTLDQLQEFIDQCKKQGLPGKTKTRQIGTSSGYNFTGTYKFTPGGKIRAGARDTQ